MTCKCPRCFRTLGHDVFVWECTGSCPAIRNPNASANAGTDVSVRQLVGQQRPPGDRRWLPSASVVCPTCNSPTRDVCPYCHYPLLAKWREAQTVCVALAGARATGKSIYVGILYKQLEVMFDNNHLTLTFADPLSRKVYEEHYERPLYKARGIMKSTAAAHAEDAYERDPIIIDMGILRTGPAMLVIRDVAGEDLENPQPDHQYLSYFQRADAVLFMFDPSAVGDVRELLKDYLPEERHKAGDPERVLDNLLHIIGAAPVPMAMILSKFDTLQALARVQDQQWSRIMSNAGAAFSRDPGINHPAARHERRGSAARGSA